MRNLPANSKTVSTHLSRERVAHREWIGGRVLTLLSHFWRDDDPVELTAAIGRDWALVLEGIPQEYIDEACVQYLRHNETKPKPMHIYDAASALMPKPAAVVGRKTTPEEDAAYSERFGRIDPERAAQAAAIMASFKGARE